MTKSPDISVLIATYNRAQELRRTLESMTRLDLEGLNVEFVIIDNNSSDRTRDIVESFASVLPVHYLFESRPGKNCALNKAIDQIELGEIVVFTDDDVEPHTDWLKVIAQSTADHSDFSVFGGRIYPIWPSVKIPAWATAAKLQAFAWGAHDYCSKDEPYSLGHYPFGGNFWARRGIFEDGRRYNEAVGPHPTHTKKCSETTFLRQLSLDGYGIIYCRKAIIGHRIQPEMLSLVSIRKRARDYGRGKAYWQEPRQGGLLARHPGIWRLIRIAGLCRWAAYYGFACLSIPQTLRIQRQVNAIASFSHNLESLKIGGRCRE